jgi:hypothetical protein
VEVNDQVVSQGIVFATVVAGFAFVIAAEIALREPLPKELAESAINFLATGLMGIVTAATGVLYFGNAWGTAQRADSGNGLFELGNGFLLFMAATGLAFLVSIISLFRRRFAGKILRDFYITMAAIIALMALLIVGSYL